MAVHAGHHHAVSPWAVGWASFAGFLMVLGGFFQLFQGLAAIFSGDFFAVGRNYILTLDVTTWGWIHAILGSIVALAGMSIFAGQAWARGIGIALALFAAIANFFFIPYYPVWSLLIIAMDIAIIWGLTVYGPEEAEV